MFATLSLLKSCQRFYLVKVPLLLVQVGSQSIGPLHINHEVFHLTLEPLFGFLKGSTLGIHCLNLFLSLLKALCQLLPVGKQYILFLDENFDILKRDDIKYVFGYILNMFWSHVKEMTEW